MTIMIPYPISKKLTPIWHVSSTIQCGFPSPAEDHQQKRLDLNELLIQQPESTFFMRVRGASMQDAGIEDGDFVIVDRSIQPKHGHIVVAVIDGEFTIKRFYQKNNLVKLLAANSRYADIEPREGQELMIWGVVTWNFKNQNLASLS